MKEILSVELMRKSDAMTIEGGTPGVTLMKRAGEGILQAILSHAPQDALARGVGIVTGSGNNAGDGYILALLLKARGVSATLVRLSSRFSDDGRYYYDACVKEGIPDLLFDESTDLSRFGVIVDCIFGTGFSGEATGLPREAIERINRSGAFVVSADINSGLNGDNGRAVTAVRSDLTVSIGSLKPGHFLASGKDLIGRLVNCDIGIAPAGNPFHLLEEQDIAAVLPKRKHNSNKSTYGYVTLIGGSACYSGAIRLAAMADAAMLSGAGVTTVAAPASLGDTVRNAILESTFFPLSEEGGNFRFSPSELDTLMARSKVIAFGMGIGNSDDTANAVRYLLQHYTGRLIIDADGLNALAGLDAALLKETSATVILTPHPMEFSRLLKDHGVNEVLNSPIALAKAYAKENRVVLLLKGASTVVTDGSEVLLVDRGCPGMATAGSGDVLSGVLAALFGYAPTPPILTTAAGAFICGYAGERAESALNAVTMTARDTVAHIREAILALAE